VTFFFSFDLTCPWDFAMLLFAVVDGFEKKIPAFWGLSPDLEK
jgi:hypothetical protein